MWVFVNFSNKALVRKQGLNKYIKFLCKMKLRDELQKAEVVGKCSVEKAFLKTSQNTQESNSVGVSFLIKLQASGLNLY